MTENNVSRDVPTRWRYSASSKTSKNRLAKIDQYMIVKIMFSGGVGTNYRAREREAYAETNEHSNIVTVGS